MTTKVLINAQVYAGPVDLTGNTNEVSLNLKVDELDRTTFASNGWRERRGGLLSGETKHKGFVDYPNPDLEMFTELGLTGIPVTIASDGGVDTASAAAYVFDALRTEYNMFGAVGDQAPLAGTFVTDKTKGVGRGKIIYDATTSGTSTGAAVELTAVSATQSFLIALHVMAVGTTATVTIESDVDNTFASPTTVATRVITALTQSELIAVTAANTDTFFRAKVTSVTGTFTFKIAAGITP